MVKSKKGNRINRTDKKSASFIGWRFLVVCGCIFIALASLIYKMAFLQVIHSAPLVREGDMRSVRTQELLTNRGMISDRAGRPLAVSVPVEAIWADVKYLNDQGGVNSQDPRWKGLASVLDTPMDKLLNKLDSNPQARFIYLARQVTPEVAQYIRQLKLPGIYHKQESRRFYPAGEIAAHLIGFTDIDGTGIEGVEKSFNVWLTGKPGERVVRKDRFGRVIENISSVDSQKAHNLSLSIDERLQSIVYRELTNAVLFNKAQSGTAVLVDVHTGEILAMANSPSYNPNNRNGVSTNIFRNRAITDAFEPGSTVKPIVLMTGLEHKVINYNTVVKTIPFMLNHHEIRDVSHSTELTLTGILQKSSNIGVSKIALQMKPDDLINAYSRLGFGKSTDLGLVGESSGIFPSQKQRWSDLERATFAFGYGEMVTPVQLARAYATLGSFGVYRPLSILRQDTPPAGVRVFSESITKSVVHMMESVALPGGGGVRAAVRGYRVAVKTGTAKKVGPQGTYINEYIAYTAGLAPASNPRYALVVIINDPKAGKYYGGAVSAPVFGSIMGGVLRTMNIEPDQPATSPSNQYVINRG